MRVPLIAQVALNLACNSGVRSIVSRATLPAGTEYDVLSTKCAAWTKQGFVLGERRYRPISECQGGHSLQVDTRSLPNAHCFSGQKPGDKNGRFWKKSRKKFGVSG